MGAFTYPRSEPGSAGHLDLVEKLNVYRTQLQDGLRDVTPEAATHNPADDEWSIWDVLAHLCDYGIHLHDRLYRMINLEEPRLQWWDEGEARAARASLDQPFDTLVGEFMQQRAATVEMLTDLVHWNWARTGRHEVRGRMSIRQIVDRAIAHDQEHLEQVRELKGRALSNVAPD